MASTQEVVNMPVSQLIPDKYNPRQEFVMEDMARLEESIKKRGILNPLLVEEVEKDQYLIIDGERRFRTAKKLGMDVVPVRVTPDTLTDQERLLVRFNLQEVHSPWTAWDKSVAVAELKEMTDWTVAELARQLGVSNASIQALLSLQELSQRTISVLQKAKIPTNAAAKVGQAIKHVEPEKARAVEAAYIAGVESGKIFDLRSSNKFVLAIKRTSVAQLHKYVSSKKYTVDKMLEENNAEHYQTEMVLQGMLVSTRSVARGLSMTLAKNEKLLVESRTVELGASTLAAINRLLTIVGKRVASDEKEE